MSAYEYVEPYVRYEMVNHLSPGGMERVMKSNVGQLRNSIQDLIDKGQLKEVTYDEWSKLTLLVLANKAQRLHLKLRFS